MSVHEPALLRSLSSACDSRDRLVRAFSGGQIREPSCIGCYEGEPGALRRQLHELFVGARGPGLPRQCPPDGRLRAALVPHIDYQRGGHSFAWGFKEIVERTDASLFVIVGTSHYSTHRFVLTRRHFRTPLGIVPTDQEFIDRLVRHYGDGLFDDESAHLPEHSIELEVVFLQYLYGGRRPIRIVPLLVGSFHDCVMSRSFPPRRHEIARMIESLRRSEDEIAEPVCFIISGDLAHLGPKFGDATPIERNQLTQSHAQDRALLASLVKVDLDGYFQAIAGEMDSRRICGFPPTTVALAAAQPAEGRVLHYDRCIDPRGFESVSFASVGFYR